MHHIGRRIGLLGGSFNPAHHGHLAISQHIYTHLQLDEIWWIVTPQNPFKTTDNTEDLTLRINYCRKICHHIPYIRIITDPSPYPHRSIHTVTTLTRSYPDISFIWMMGADNLIHFHRWHRWYDIASSVPLVIYDRKPYSYRALRSKAAYTLCHRYIAPQHAALLPFHDTPAWSFLRLPTYNISSTEIRNNA